MEQNDNDKDIRELFENFRPELPSDEEFMQSLDRRLDAVETLRSIAEKQRRSSRIAVAAALAAGFASGVVCTLLMPWLLDTVGGLWSTVVPADSWSYIPLVICWIMVSSITVLTAMKVFTAVRSMVSR